MLSLSGNGSVKFGLFLAGAGTIFFFALSSCGEGDEKTSSDSASDTAIQDSDPGSECATDTGSGPPHDNATDTGTSPAVDTGPWPIDTGGQCPAGMVPVENQFCIDAYEASRVDATSSSSGSDESMAQSVSGVMPWKVSSLAEAEAACGAAGKRLCEPGEWYQACTGPDGTEYPYGDTYEAETCNGIDTHCDCEDGSHYDGCYYECGGSYYLLATGSLGSCTNEYGVFDISGNLWEYVAGAADDQVRGGAYNCGDSASTHKCDFDLTWTPSARGFRCCHDGYF